VGEGEEEEEIRILNFDKPVIVPKWCIDLNLHPHEYYYQTQQSSYPTDYYYQTQQDMNEGFKAFQF